VQRDVARAISDAINKRDGSASTQITVVKRTRLQRGVDNFNPTGKDCREVDANLNCRSYLRTLTYTIKDQFGDTFGPWAFFADESFTPPSATGCVVTSMRKGPGFGTGIGFFDDFFFCSAACPQCNPNGKGCTITSTQTWRVNGFVVRRNNVTWTCSDATIQEIP